MTTTRRSRFVEWQTRHPFAILVVFFLIVWGGSVLLTVYHRHFDLRLGLLLGGFLFAGFIWVAVNKSLPVNQWVKERPFIQFLVGLAIALPMCKLIAKAYYTDIKFPDMVVYTYVSLLFWAIERLPADSPIAFLKDPLGIQRKGEMKLAEIEREERVRDRTTPPPFEGLRRD